MRYLIAGLFSLGGLVILVSLGIWQLQRLEWKETLLAEMSQRMDAASIPLPPTYQPVDRFQPVTLAGQPVGDPIFVFGTWRGRGAGHRVISALQAGERRVLVDLGFTPEREIALPETLDIRGNLDWPEESGRFTPEPDGDLWFARNVPDLADALGADPILVVAAETQPATDVLPTPVSTAGIPNNHLGYAIQWFGLAFVWAGMTLFLAWRIRQRTI